MDILATVILLAGVVDDLRSQKVHNKLIIFLFLLTVVAIVFLSGPIALLSSSLGFFMALAFSIPLVLVGVLGGGDMKLFAVFGLATNVSAVLGVAVYSIFWGALLGVVRALISGQFKALMLSTTHLLWAKGGSTATEFKIPYTIALFFGWLTHMTLLHMGVSPW